MIENLVLNQLSVDESDNKYTLNVQLKNADTETVTTYSFSVKELSPVAFIEEVFKKASREMAKAQFGYEELKPEDKLPNKEIEED